MIDPLVFDDICINYEWERIGRTGGYNYYVRVKCKRCQTVFTVSYGELVPGYVYICPIWKPSQ